MSAFRTLDQGIKALQAGNQDEGGRLIRLALRGTEITGSVRATAYNWLAEATNEREEKIQAYLEALKVDPSNELAQYQLSRLYAPPTQTDSGNIKTVDVPGFLPESNPLVAPPPPAPVYQPSGVTMHAQSSPPPAPSAPPSAPAAAPTAQGNITTVGISDGPNGPGTGFFITQSGIIATTRYVTGGLHNVTVHLDRYTQLPGRVIRSFPYQDIALVHVDYRPSALLPFSPYPYITPNTPLKAQSFVGGWLYGNQRNTERQLAQHWFPTDILQVPDAGGNPVFNEQDQLVGMLTRNISSSSAYVYGVNLADIRRALEVFQGEMQSERNRHYCSACGYISAASAAGGYYCENCGTTMSQSQNVHRQLTQHSLNLYAERNSPPCVHCGAQAGLYQQQCLRCGQEVHNQTGFY
jgi:hypothetical protein